MVAEDPPVPFLALVPPSAGEELPQRLTHHLRAVRPLSPTPAPASRPSEAIDGREAGLVNRNRNGLHMGTMIAEREPTRDRVLAKGFAVVARRPVK